MSCSKGKAQCSDGVTICTVYDQHVETRAGSCLGVRSDRIKV